MSRKKVLRFKKQIRTWLYLSTVEVKNKKIYNCKCKSQKCNGKYIRTQPNQKTCLWDYLEKQNTINK